MSACMPEPAVDMQLQLCGIHELLSVSDAMFVLTQL